jgi:hypothetical protein
MEKSKAPYAFEYDGRKSYGDLEVAPGNEEEAWRSHEGLHTVSQWEARRSYGNLEVIPEYGKEVRYHRDAPIWVSGPGRSFEGLEEDTVKDEPGKRPKRICGLRPPIFWIVSVIVVLLIGGAVGGGIGGTLVIRNRDDTPSTTGKWVSFPYLNHYQGLTIA